MPMKMTTSQNQWWKRPSGVAAVCLGLLCVLLLARIIGLSVHLKVFGNSNYYVFMEQRNWEYAKQDCLKRGAQLVIINNQEEQKFLVSLNIRFWIGLSDIENKGTWRWVDGTPLTTAYWGEKEPNNEGGGEDCAEIRHVFTDPVKKWNDNSCTSQLNWICEKPID
ncbi:C-type lectin domain family 4 member M-like isoform X2 [Esox lucius]|uniref:C-type lectin domain family 4 member M-like isoform X2 n=1 Tax=Esox lucius TaxID=8010 RepID=UPI0014772993|nr:C-type lectin domain family 4 member M-like isoform X2 [Esox lucius]